MMDESLQDLFHFGVTVAGIVGTGYDALRFEAPVMTSIERNKPHSGAVSLTVQGLNFGASDYSVSVNLHDTTCQV